MGQSRLSPVIFADTRRTPEETRRATIRSVATYVVASFVSLIAALVVLRVWRADLSIPFAYLGDATNVAAYFKTILETGWYETQPLLAAPFGQNYHDYKTADNLHMFLAIPLTSLLGSYGLAMNAYFLAGFPLAAAAAVWFFRVLRLPHVLAGSLAVLFALAPYHFARNEWHLWLASYYPIPLAMALIMLILQGKQIWGTTQTPLSPGGRIPWRALGTVAVAIVVGSSNSYYAFVTVLLVSVVGLALFVGDRNWRRLGGTASFGLAIALVAVLNMLPDMIDSWSNGRNAGAVIRSPGEVETYALKLSQLLLPIPGHRVEAFAQLRSVYDQYYPIAAGSTALGAVAAVGVLTAGIVVIVSFLQPRRIRVLETPEWALLRQLASLTVFCLLLATVGGLGVFVSFFTSDLRGWDRVAIYIGLSGLGTVGVSLTWFVKHVQAHFGSRTKLHHFALPLAALLIVPFGLLDQTSPQTIPDYAATSTSYAQDASFVKALESKIPFGSSVLQLPYSAYPESAPINGVIDSDQLKPFLHSAHLKWSGGAIKGRPTTDWLAISLSRYGLESTLTAASLKGFNAVVIDRQSLGSDPDAVLAETTRILGDTAALITTPRYLAMSLDSLRERADSSMSSTQISRAMDQTFLPVVATLEPNLRSGFSIPQLFKGFQPRISVTNPRSATAQVTVRIEGSDADVTDLRAWFGTQGIDTAATGSSALTFSWDAPSGESVIDLPGPQNTTIFSALAQNEQGFRITVDIPD